MPERKHQDEVETCRYCGAQGPFQQSFGVLYLTAPLSFLIGKPICKTCYGARIWKVWLLELAIVLAVFCAWRACWRP